MIDPKFPFRVEIPTAEQIMSVLVGFPKPAYNIGIWARNQADPAHPQVVFLLTDGRVVVEEAEKNLSSISIKAGDRFTVLTEFHPAFTIKDAEYIPAAVFDAIEKKGIPFRGLYSANLGYMSYTFKGGVPVRHFDLSFSSESHNRNENLINGFLVPGTQIFISRLPVVSNISYREIVDALSSH